MYKILKEKGNNANVTLVNMETSASLIIGKITMGVLKTLEHDGYSFDGEKAGMTSISIRDKWDMSISDDTAKILGATAMKMSRPKRESKKADSEQEAKDLFKKPNNKIDAMDVLLGLASYN